MQKLEITSLIFVGWILCYTVGYVGRVVWERDGYAVPWILVILAGFAIFVVGLVYMACSILRFNKLHRVKK